jgi:hypothetical protein
MSFKEDKAGLGDRRMKTIETTAVVTPAGTMTVQVPPDIPPGEHQVVLVIDEHPIAKKKRAPLKFSAYAVGLVSEEMTFRREDIYGEWGR